MYLSGQMNVSLVLLSVKFPTSDRTKPRTRASSSDSLVCGNKTGRLRPPRSMPSLLGHLMPFLWPEAEHVRMFTSWICDVIDPSGACGRLSIRPRCPVYTGQLLRGPWLRLERPCPHTSGLTVPCGRHPLGSPRLRSWTALRPAPGAQ